MLDLQKATNSNRISAFLTDLIALFIVVIGISNIFANIVGYDAKSDKLQAIYDEYEQQYIYDAFNATFGTETGPYSNEEINKMITEDEATYLEWYNARVAEANVELNKDEEAKALYGVVVNLSIFNVMISILVGYALLEFVVPLLFKNGQTIGKKIFGIGLMRVDGLKLSPLQLAARTFLGKYTIETMIPVLVIMAMYFSALSGDLVLLGLGVVAAIIIIECILFFKSEKGQLIHDAMAMTICIDIKSQRIFETEEELIEYKERMAEENVGKTGYGKESSFSVYSSAGAVEIDDATSEKIYKKEKEEGSDAMPTLTLSTITVGDETYVNTAAPMPEVEDEDNAVEEAETPEVDEVEETEEMEEIGESEEELLEVENTEEDEIKDEEAVAGEAEETEEAETEESETEESEEN